MSTTSLLNTNAAQSQELMQLLLHLSSDEVANLQRLLHHVQRLRSSVPNQRNSTQAQQRSIEPEDNAPVWDLGFVDEFDRMSCYENMGDEA
jgi:hypothetical protein